MGNIADLVDSIDDEAIQKTTLDLIDSIRNGKISTESALRAVNNSVSFKPYKDTVEEIIGYYK